MNSKQEYKDSKLDAATTEMEEAIAVIKNLSKSVKIGTATKKELEDAIKDLSTKTRKVEILSAESKVLSGWKTPNFSAVTNEKKDLNVIWMLATAVALYILIAK